MFQPHPHTKVLDMVSAARFITSIARRCTHTQPVGLLVYCMLDGVRKWLVDPHPPGWDSAPCSIKSKFSDLGLARAAHANAGDQRHIPSRDTGARGLEVANLEIRICNQHIPKLRFRRCTMGRIINRQIALSSLGRGLIDLDPDSSKSIELD